MAKWYDASLPLKQGMLSFPGDPVFELQQTFQTSAGDAFNLSSIRMSTHTGTHVDPPAHYLPNGQTVDELPLDALIGPGTVLDLRSHACIDRRALERSPLQDFKRILFKTDNSPKLLERQFTPDYVYLTEDGAEFLIEHGTMLVGIDYLSIERYGNKGASVHRRLLGAGVVVVEAVNLALAPPGPCEIFCLPLCIEQGDGAPARVVIRTANGD
ncbi:MAG: cyclase family protein [Desulfomonilaceae bacterium]